MSDQRLIFTSLASSAFLVYLDPEHPTNRVRTFLIAQGSATLLGFGSVSLLGSGFLAAGVATVTHHPYHYYPGCYAPARNFHGAKLCFPHELEEGCVRRWFAGRIRIASRSSTEHPLRPATLELLSYFSEGSLAAGGIRVIEKVRDGFIEGSQAFQSAKA